MIMFGHFYSGKKMMEVELLVYLAIWFIINAVTTKDIRISPKGKNDAICYMHECRTLRYAIDKVADENDTLFIDGGTEGAITYKINDSIYVKKSLNIEKDPNSVYKPILQYTGKDTLQDTRYVFEISWKHSVRFTVQSIIFKDVNMVRSIENDFPGISSADFGSQYRFLNPLFWSRFNQPKRQPTIIIINNSNLSGLGVTINLRVPAEVYITNCTFHQSTIVLHNTHQNKSLSKVSIQNVVFSDQNKRTISAFGFIESVSLKDILFKNINMTEQTLIRMKYNVDGPPGWDDPPSTNQSEIHTEPPIIRPDGVITDLTKVPLSLLKPNTKTEEKTSQSMRELIGRNSLNKRKTSTTPKTLTTKTTIPHESQYPGHLGYIRPGLLPSLPPITRTTKKEIDLDLSKAKKSISPEFAKDADIPPVQLPWPETEEKFLGGTEGNTDDEKSSKTTTIKREAIGPVTRTDKRKRRNGGVFLPPHFVLSPFYFESIDNSVINITSLNSSPKMKTKVKLHNVTLANNFVIDTLIAIENSLIDSRTISLLNNKVDVVMRISKTEGKFSDTLIKNNTAGKFIDISQSVINLSSTSISSCTLGKPLAHLTINVADSSLILRSFSIQDTVVRSNSFLKASKSSTLRVHHLRIAFSSMENFISGIDCVFQIDHCVVRDSRMYSFLKSSSGSISELTNIILTGNNITNIWLVIVSASSFNGINITITDNWVNELIYIYPNTSMKLKSSLIERNILHKNLLTAYEANSTLLDVVIRENNGSMECAFCVDKYSSLDLTNVSIKDNLFSVAKFVQLTRQSTGKMKNLTVVGNSLFNIIKVVQMDSRCSMMDSSIVGNHISEHAFFAETRGKTALTIVNNRFEDNIIKQCLISCDGWGTTIVSSNTIINNSINATILLVSGSKISADNNTIINNTIAGNIIKSSEPYLYNTYARIYLTNTSIVNNTCFNVFLFVTCTVELRNVRIESNTAESIYSELYYVVSRQANKRTRYLTLINVHLKSRHIPTTLDHTSILVAAPYAVIVLQNVTIQIDHYKTRAMELSLKRDRSSSVNVRDIFIHCPTGSEPRDNSIIHGLTYVYDVKCLPCSNGFYDTQSGAMKIVIRKKIGVVQIGDRDDIEYVDGFEKKFINELSCKECPVGGVCLNGITRSRGNFYGFFTSAKYNKNEVQYKTCPLQYCCDSKETCSSHNSCQMNREGAFCGKCKKGYFEDFFSPECLEVSLCTRSGGFWLMFLVYAIALLAILIVLDYIKVIFSHLKGCLSSNKPEDEEVDEDIVSGKGREVLLSSHDIFVDSVLKYTHNDKVRTLLYHHSNKPPRHSPTIDRRHLKSTSDPNPVGDDEKASDDDVVTAEYTIGGIFGALTSFYQIKSLLTVQIPGHYESKDDNSKAKMIVDTLADIFNVDIVISFGSSFCPFTTLSAASKLFIKVIAFNLLLVTLIILPLMTCLFVRKIYHQQKSKFFKVIFNVLCFSYIKILLFIYKNTASATLILLNCVDINGEKVLYLQGDLVCYSTWQYIIAVVLVVWVIPFPFALWISYRLYRKELITVFEMMGCLSLPPIAFWYLIRPQKEGSEEKKSNHGDGISSKLIDLFEEPYRQKETGESTPGHQFIFWEHWRLIQRLLLSAVTTFTINPLKRVCYVLPCIIAFALIYFKVKPFKVEMKLLHWLELISLFGYCLLATSNTFRGFLYVFNIPNKVPIPNLLLFFFYVELLISPVSILIGYFLFLPILKKILYYTNRKKHE